MHQQNQLSSLRRETWRTQEVSEIIDTHTTYSNTYYRDQLWPSRGTRCLGGFVFSWKPVSGSLTLPLKTSGAWKPLSVKKKSQLEKTTQHSKVLRRHLGSGLLWEIFHISFACGNYKASKKLILVLTSSAPKNPRSVLRLQVNRRNKRKTSHWQGLNWSLRAWRSSLFTSSDDHCYFMFIGCDGFNHMLAVYRHSGGIISAWRWIVQNREKGENLSSLFKHIP